MYGTMKVYNVSNIIHARKKFYKEHGKTFVIDKIKKNGKQYDINYHLRVKAKTGGRKKQVIR